MMLPKRYPIVGTSISSTSYAEVLSCILNRPDSEALVIACCNVHSVMSASRDSELTRALNAAQIATPDGMPLVWALNSLHNQRLEDRVYGPDLMLHVMTEGSEAGLRHFLLGSKEETLSKLKARLTDKLPGLMVSGSLAPPFAPVEAMDLPQMVDAIESSGANVVWFGLGMPKQELLMHRLQEKLPGYALIGVGAAFDFHAGTISQAPRWMQDRGLEWAYRFSQEPRRLLGRYLWNNPNYLLWFGRQLVRNKWSAGS